MSNKQKSITKNNAIIPALIFGTISIVISLIILTFIFSIVISKVDIPDNIISVLSTFIISFCSFISSLVCSKIIGSKGLLIGAICGVSICTILLLIGIIILNSSFSSIGLIKSIAIISSSLIGGVIGVNFKLKRKF